MGVLSKGKLISQFFDIFHSVGAEVAGKRTRLTDWVDLTHVTDWWGHVLVLVFYKVVDLFIGRVAAGNEVVLKEVRVVRPSCIVEGLSLIHI